MSYSENLQAIFTERKADYSEYFSLRIHRAISWLKRSEQAEDEDTQFISLWIAFNAAYARETNISGMRFPDQSVFIEFLDKIIRLDDQQIIYKLIWKTYAGNISLLMENHYTFSRFGIIIMALLAKMRGKKTLPKQRKKP